MFRKEFPRKADTEELAILFRILPEEKSGYREYRKLLKEYYFITTGSIQDTFILSRDKNTDYSPFVTQVFAAGSFQHKDKVAEVVIHEEIDETIEVGVDITDNVPEGFKDTIYPEWVPGRKAPGDNSEIREVILDEGKYLLAFAPVHQKLWLYDYNSGVNFFIPPGSYYSSLCVIKNIRDPETVMNPKLLYKNLDNYSDNELFSAFYLYNKSIKRFRLEMPVVKEPEKKVGFFKSYLKKDNN
jgi:hypothetical protein